jgi:hypothetical protein
MLIVVTHLYIGSDQCFTGVHGQHHMEVACNLSVGPSLLFNTIDFDSTLQPGDVVLEFSILTLSKQIQTIDQDKGGKKCKF